MQADQHPCESTSFGSDLAQWTIDLRLGDDQLRHWVTRLVHNVERPGGSVSQVYGDLLLLRRHLTPWLPVQQVIRLDALLGDPRWRLVDLFQLRAGFIGTRKLAEFSTAAA